MRTRFVLAIVFILVLAGVASCGEGVAVRQEVPPVAPEQVVVTLDHDAEPVVILHDTREIHPPPYIMSSQRQQYEALPVVHPPPYITGRQGTKGG